MVLLCCTALSASLASVNGIRCYFVALHAFHYQLTSEEVMATFYKIRLTSPTYQMR